MRSGSILEKPLHAMPRPHFTLWGEAEAWRFLDAIKANGVKLVTSNDEAKDLVASGELAWAFTDTDDASVTAEDYVTAARALGCGTTRIMFRHTLPNVAGPVLILGTLYLAFAVLTAATLSFLGVGVRPPIAERGAMVNEGRNVLVTGWWVSLFPSVMIVVFVLAVNLVADGLNDALDPRLRRR